MLESLDSLRKKSWKKNDNTFHIKVRKILAETYNQVPHKINRDTVPLYRFTAVMLYGYTAKSRVPLYKVIL